MIAVVFAQSSKTSDFISGIGAGIAALVAKAVSVGGPPPKPIRGAPAVNQDVRLARLPLGCWGIMAARRDRQNDGVIPTLEENDPSPPAVMAGIDPVTNVKSRLLPITRR
jgi:hypothetical protein